MKCDYHVHSEFSDDSSTPIELQVKRACDLGIDELCLTDHVDYGVKQDCDCSNPEGMPLNVNYPEYFREIERLRSKYHGRITIRAGLEFGVQTHTIRQYEKLYDRYRNELDFVLLSIHQIDNLDFWAQEFQHGKTQEQYNQAYYDEMLNLVQNFHDYSVLAHLDLLSRYDRAGIYPFAKVKDIVAEILTIAINDGKGIELNTSGWRYGLGQAQPCREILELYHDLGGKIITLGSDAHNPSYIYDHMNDGISLLKSIGFREFCTFDKMRPVFHAL